MGLDMYLYAKKWLSEYAKNKKDILIKKKINSLFKNGLKAKEISFEVGYWRKANQIHNWFVEKVQNGIDNCGEYYVIEENLLLLLKTINEVLKKKKTKGIEKKKEKILEGLGNGDLRIAKAKELLPCSQGFFFGGEEYDKYYFEQLKETRKIIRKALILIKKGYMIYYTSSW